jgi:hypothetical protein
MTICPEFLPPIEECLYASGVPPHLADHVRRCARSRHARFRSTGKPGGILDVFGMSAVCATASGRATQSGELVRAGANRFTGDFYNSEYNFSGRISITLEGRSLSAVLRGDNGSARLSLSR